MLYNDDGTEYQNYFMDPKNVEAIFKLLAFSAASAIVVRILAGGEAFTTDPQTVRQVAAFLAGMALFMLQFFYANATVIDSYIAYRESKGLKAGRVRLAFAKVFAIGLGAVWPMYSVLTANSSSIGLALGCK
jgi:hypothetical protein